MLRFNEFFVLSENIKKGILYNIAKKSGHILDNLPSGTQTTLIPSKFFEKEKDAWGKVSEGKIAYHNRASDDKYWTHKINQGDRPPVAIDYDIDNNQLRVTDGNHRLNVYFNKNIKDIPTILSIKAVEFLTKGIIE